jgi:hypothetical protein
MPRLSAEGDTSVVGRSSAEGLLCQVEGSRISSFSRRVLHVPSPLVDGRRVSDPFVPGWNLSSGEEVTIDGLRGPTEWFMDAAVQRAHRGGRGPGCAR